MTAIDGTPEATQSDARPVGYHVVTPPDWHRIALDEARRRATVERLVNQQFRGHDDLPHIRAMAIEQLDRNATEAAAAGGIEMYVSTLVVQGITLSSSLVTSLAVPPLSPDRKARSGPLSREDLEQVALALGAGSSRMSVQTSEVRSLGAGDAVRRTSTTVTDLGADDEGQPLPAVESFGVDWFVPVPQGDGALLLFAFSSPLMPLRPGLEGLFDAVVGTVRWT